MKEWIEDFKNCFKDPQENRYKHISFKKIKPVAKDDIGARLITNEKLWYLLFKIAKEVCQMEEVLDLFKEALKMNLPNIDLIKQEFDAFYNGFVRDSQLKSPSANISSLLDLSQEMPNENALNNYNMNELTDEPSAKADGENESIVSGTSNQAKKKVIRSSKKPSRQNTSKRRRTAFESSYNLNEDQKENIPCSTSQKKLPKNSSHSKNNTEVHIQLGSYTKFHALDQVSLCVSISSSNVLYLFYSLVLR